MPEWPNGLARGASGLVPTQVRTLSPAVVFETMKGIITLRGHHISTLAVYYLNLYESSKGKKPRALKGYRDYFNLPKRGKSPYIANRLFWDIIQKPELEIQLTDDLDILCLGDQNHLPCLKRTPEDNCERDDEGIDKRHLGEYNLKVGQIVRSKELLEVITTYYNRWGFLSPRVKQLEEKFSKTQAF